MRLEKYSIGIGDRFGHQGVAQLRAVLKAQSAGVSVAPVWNKSNREHTIIGTTPDHVRREADAAVTACGWNASYYVDADHIGLTNVDRFIKASNFFTIDVADRIGQPADDEAIRWYVRAMSEFKGKIDVPGLHTPLEVTDDLLQMAARKYVAAVAEADRVYRHIARLKGAGTFITEISVDESATAQSPAELFLILGAIAQRGIPLQTIAPKFSGAFLKGVDYVGDVHQFAREFEDDIAVIAFAIKTFGLLPNLKLSVHSGSDKFSLYPVMHRILKKHDAGVHLKTAGTTWLEEVIGLAASGDDGLALVKQIYTQAYNRFEEMAAPYRAVIHIEREKLPLASDVQRWTGEQLVRALRHDPTDECFDPQMRQLMHIAFRVAAEMGARYTEMLERHAEVVGTNVTDNLYRRHLLPLFVGTTD